MDFKAVKKLSLGICAGPTQSVSISERGPCTPRRNEPNVKILHCTEYDACVCGFVCMCVCVCVRGFCLLLMIRFFCVYFM